MVHWTEMKTGDELDAHITHLVDVYAKEPVAYSSSLLDIVALVESTCESWELRKWANAEPQYKYEAKCKSGDKFIHPGVGYTAAEAVSIAWVTWYYATHA